MILLALLTACLPPLNGSDNCGSGLPALWGLALGEGKNLGIWKQTWLRVQWLRGEWGGGRDSSWASVEKSTAWATMCGCPTWEARKSFTAWPWPVSEPQLSGPPCSHHWVTGLVELPRPCVYIKSLQPCPTLRNPMDHTTRLLCSWGFSRQEHWSGLPCPPPGNLPDPGIEPASPTLAGGSSTIGATWEAVQDLTSPDIQILFHEHLHFHFW